MIQNVCRPSLSPKSHSTASMQIFRCDLVLRNLILILPMYGWQDLLKSFILILPMYGWQIFGSFLFHLCMVGRIFTTSSGSKCTRREIFQLCRFGQNKIKVNNITVVEGELLKPKPYLELYHMLLQEDKSSWTKIDVATDKMLTKFITIKGEDVFAKQPYKDLKVYTSKGF